VLATPPADADDGLPVEPISAPRRLKIPAGPGTFIITH
jgi:hypothetical protein